MGMKGSKGKQPKPGQPTNQPGYQPGIQQPGYQAGYQPGIQQPGYQPGYQQPGYYQPGFQGGYPQQINYNFNQFGLSDYEIQTLQNYFQIAAGRDGRIDRQEFTALYAQLNPNTVGPYLQTFADRAFMASDLNKDGFITYDEFVAAYVLSKTQPQNFQANATHLLNHHANTPGYLTQQEAIHYTNWAHNYFGNPVGVPPPEQIVGRFAHYETIPIEEFVEYTVPLYSDHLYF